MPRVRENKQMRLVDRAQAGETLAPFLSMDAVQEFFAEYEADRINEMTKAEPDDDEVRRNASLKLRAMRDFKAHLESKVTRGERAKQDLENLQ